MLGWITEPFASDIVLRALVAGAIVGCLCAVVGTWVVLRGAAFLGDAMSHGVLPGVALASLLGGNVFVGALIAALAMAYGVSALGGSRRLSVDTSIGLLMVGMLAAGVMIVSHSRSFAVDLTDLLFGDVLAVRTNDIALLATALVLTVAAAVIGRRAFIAATFDARKAATLGLRPELAAAALTALIAVAIVASFRVVGTLLVFGLLIAPPAAAMLWASTILQIVVGAAVIGTSSVALGLVVSWHAGTAGGATIAAVAVGIFFCSLAAATLRRHLVKAAVLLTTAACVAACGGGGEPVAPSTTPARDDETPPAGVRESAEPVTRLVIVDPATGEASVLDVVDEVETPVGSVGPVDKLSGDGRFGYLHGGGALTIVDAGSWTFDHGDHNHYYLTAPAIAGTVDVEAVAVTADQDTAAVRTGDGTVRLLDREQLGDHETVSPEAGFGDPRDVAAIAPFRDKLIVVTRSGAVQAVDEQGAIQPLPAHCPVPTEPAATRRAVIFGCADGALRVTASGTKATASTIPFPAEEPAAALGQLQHRVRDDMLTAIAGDEVWVLDSGRRTWSTVSTPGAVAVSTGDDGEVLILTRDGVLHATDIATGVENASLRLLPGGAPVHGPAAVIEVDSDRAYVNNSGTHEIYEIDYGDGLRLARTFKTDVAPGLMVQAGR